MKVKVCGMSHNISEVANLGPAYMGFIFWEGSPRYFDGVLPPISEKIRKVGVFVNAPITKILQKTKKYGLQAVQLHGRETPEFCDDLKKALATFGEQGKKIEVLKVFHIKDQFNFELLDAFEPVCDFYLFDSKGKLPGGNGYGFDWQVLQGYPSEKPYFLSGGIGPDDLPKLREFFKRPEARYCQVLDVNSRFESEAGRKETARLKKFIMQVQGLY